MNSRLESHYTDDVLELYAMGKLSSVASALLGKHLLICPACQTNLLDMQEYILVIRAALGAAAAPAVPEPTLDCLDPDGSALVDA